jgi:hypothetical protein
MLTLRCRQADIVATYDTGDKLLLLLLLPAINYRRCSLLPSVGDKLITGVIESIKIWDKSYSPVSTTPAIIYHWCL